MELWLDRIGEHGLLVVFLNVLLEQLGVPVPTYPVLFVTGALAARGVLPGWALLGVAVLACLIADTAWYLAGRRYGRRVLRLLCRISLSPDSCVRQTESVFSRWGAPSLVVAKFVPGFASVATALAGAMAIRRVPFLLFDALGAALWAGTGLLLGALFSDAIEDLIAVLILLGRWGVGLIGAAVAVFVAVKWWRRHRFAQMLRMARIDPAGLTDLVRQGRPPLILDVRTAEDWSAGRIPGARLLAAATRLRELDDHDRAALVVVYCDCPNDASAALAARRLLEAGYRSVLPLRGGFTAWVSAAGPVER